MSRKLKMEFEKLKDSKKIMCFDIESEIRTKIKNKGADMKNIKKLNRSQKELLQEHGYSPRNWYVIKNTPSYLEIISKQSLRTSNKTKIIYKSEVIKKVC